MKTDVTGSREIQQQKVIEMYRQGLEPTHISEQLGIAIHSVLRWLQTASSTEETQKSILPLELQPAFANAPNDEAWVRRVEETLFEHWRIHGKARQQLNEAFQNELASAEVNVRRVHVLSQCLDRHLRGERESLHSELLDVNRAVKLLHTHGFSVVNLSEVKTLMEQSSKRQ